MGIFRNFGQPLYSIETTVDPESRKYMPDNVFEASVAVLEKEGLLGEHHVTEKGYFLPGLADTERMRRGVFDIFYRSGEERNVREFAEDLEREANIRNDPVLEKAAEHATATADLLNKFDPLSYLPLEIYTNLPRIQSMEIVTPAGIQSVHLHCEGEDNVWGIVRLIRPKKESYWFDFDVVYDRLFDECMSMSVLPEEDSTFLSRIRRYLDMGRWKKLMDAMRSLKTDPDEVTSFRGLL